MLERYFEGGEKAIMTWNLPKDLGKVSLGSFAIALGDHLVSGGSTVGEIGVWAGAATAQASVFLGVARSTVIDYAVSEYDNPIEFFANKPSVNKVVGRVYDLRQSATK